MRNPYAGMPREVPVLSGVAFAVAVGFGVVAPVIPVFARTFGVGRAAAAAVVSVFAAMRLLSALGAGRVVDRFGERRILALGIAVVAVSSALAGLAQSYPQLVALRGAGGIGSAMFTVSAYSLLLRSAPAAQRGQATGLFTGGFLVGGITGPAIGGVISEISLRAPFFLYAGTLAVAGSIGLLLLPRPAEGATAGENRPAASLRAALRSRAYRAALAAQLGDSWAVLGVRAALVPLFVAEGLREGRIWIGIGFGIVAGLNALVLLPAGRFADRVGRRPILLGGTVLSALGMAVLAVATGLALYLVALVVLGLGAGLLDVAPGAIVGDTVSTTGPPGASGARGGMVVAVFQMTGDLGSVLGPLIAGVLADGVGFGAGFGVTAGVLAVAAAFALAAPETRRATAAAEASGGPEVSGAEEATEPPAGLPAASGDPG